MRPRAALSDRATACRRRPLTWRPRLRRPGRAVRQPRIADVPAGDLGYRVRVGRIATEVAADAEQEQLVAAGVQDGDLGLHRLGRQTRPTPARGAVQVLTIDPRRFDGTLRASYGPDSNAGRPRAQLAGPRRHRRGQRRLLRARPGGRRARGPGRGRGVRRAAVSEPVAGRPALVLRDDAAARGSTRFGWRGLRRRGGRRPALDGIDRVPGPDPQLRRRPPTIAHRLPLHDVTCTDDRELVAFDPRVRPPHARPVPATRSCWTSRPGHRSPGRPRRRRSPAGGRTLQATGARSPSRCASGIRSGRLPVRVGTAMPVTGGEGPPSRPRSVVNGGPRAGPGRPACTPPRDADGMAPAGRSELRLRLGAQAEPAHLRRGGRRGRTVLVTVDGRSTDEPRPRHRRDRRGGQVARPAGRDQPRRRRLDHDGRPTAQVINAPSDARR